MDFTASFLRVANTNPAFKESVDIIKANSDGRAWIIGGFVCRSIIQDLYGTQMPEDADFDFIVERPHTEFHLPDGWKMTMNSFGNPRFIGPKYQIDYVPLEGIRSIVDRGLEPKIENYLTGTPLNVQSLIYDIEAGQIIGEIGMESIREKFISINNREEAGKRVLQKGITLSDLVTDIATQFGFTPKI